MVQVQSKENKIIKGGNKGYLYVQRSPEIEELIATYAKQEDRTLPNAMLQLIKAGLKHVGLLN
jgi:hypothetical protein